LSGSGTVDFGSLSGSAVGIVNNTASSTVTMSIGALNTNTTFSGSIIANSGVPTAQIAVTKVGSGILTLSGANTYTGNTTINAGTLQVDGSLGATAIILNGGTFKVGSAGSISSSTITINGGSFDASALVGGYTVGSGQTIKGTGTFTGKVTIGAGGTLAPGNSPGVVTFDNDLTLAGTTAMEFLGTVRGDPTIGYDGVNLTGTGSNTLTYGGTLSMSFNAPLAAGVYDLFQLGSVAQGGDFASVGASGTEVGSFSGLVINTGIGWTATLVDIQGVPTTWTLAFNNTTGDLTIAAIPEPSIYAALTGFGAVGFAAYRRRRNVKRAA
jgi:autotransporter-associated beta strand protein